MSIKQVKWFKHLVQGREDVLRLLKLLGDK